MMKKPAKRLSFYARPVSGRGFSLVEVMISCLIVATTGIGLVGTVTVARQIAELDKQRIAAISQAKKVIEEKARHDLYPMLTPLQDVAIDDFNTPEEADDLVATMTMRMYDVNDDGSRGAELTVSPLNDQILEVEVIVSWNRSGSRSASRMTEVVRTYVTPDL